MKQRISDFLKKRTIVDMVRAACCILLVLLLAIVVMRSGRLWWLALALSFLLLLVFCINCFLIDKFVVKSLMYSVEYVLLLVFSLLFPNNFLSTVYSLILFDFYMNNTFKSNLAFGIFSYAAYAASIITAALVIEEHFSLRDTLTDAANEFIVFTLVFTIANMLSAIIARNMRIEENLKELAEREQRLREAQQSLKEVARLEERNRIAKEIHDTTGHSITTIVMLTEAAKLQLDSSPEEAKNKIVAAHIQAVNALEELRRSVRVLSGEQVPFDLAANIAKAINETTEGTGIAIRSKYPKTIDLPADTAFFLYSSLKEGLNNGIRHGKATAFYFELKICDDKIEFLLSDNGKGRPDPQLGFGLKSMKENAEKRGGSIEFVSADGEGFEIRMALPLSPARQNDIGPLTK